MAKTKAHPELKFERKNSKVPKIPSHARIQKRPIPHPPTASPYAGAKVPKIVYVSTKTPFMSAAKRVQKLLKQAERRATSKIDLSEKTSDKQKFGQLAESTEELKKEAVFLKATGRAIDKAMDIGKWFGAKEEYAIKVKTGTVLVVDDIVEDEGARQTQQGTEEPLSKQKADGDESMDLEPSSTGDAKTQQSQSKSAAKKQKRRAKHAVDENGDLLESRTRWVNMVEIAVTLK
ncbi:hypothetical protein FQN52_000299 [Onygenales sp. PD_12]|nr:hypothetical protein FQN52_000299 [Onygenales sp. PD_12]KAK2800631.1 hypothetical protein FQN51_006014 [Onygenales sp. PD_10]